MVIKNIKNNGSIRINGERYNDKSITISKNQIIIDGEEIITDDKAINVTIEGDVNSISGSNFDSITIIGNVCDIETLSSYIIH